ncbi:MAG: 50S ribosomal protein L6, partial [Candidatus Kariarchaeaceae archaeon]
EDVTVNLDGKVLTVKGKLGQVVRDFTHTGVVMDMDNDIISLEVLFPRKKEKALIVTVRAHIENAFNGVRYGYRYYLKIVFSHFPIRVNPEGNKVKIENLYGGRKPRFATIIDGVKVRVDGDDVIVEGVDKEKVGQTAANIQELTRQRGKRRQSPKTFMDGVFIFNKEFQETPEMTD